MLLAGWYQPPAIGQASPPPVVVTSAAEQAAVNINNLYTPQPKPSYDQQVLVPLHKAQALEVEKAAEAQAAELATERTEQAQAAAARVAQAAQIATQAPGDIQSLIVKWANYYGVSSDWMLQVANCESGFNPSAVNHGYYAGGGNPTGLFQFLPATFEANAARAGLVNPSIWSADDSAHVAAYMFSIGQSGQWECK